MTKKNSVYVVTSACSGNNSGYQVDCPYVDGVFLKKADAEKCFKEVKKEYKNSYGHAEICSEKDFWEITANEEDYHAVVKIDRVELGTRHF